MGKPGKKDIQYNKVKIAIQIVQYNNIQYIDKCIKSIYNSIVNDNITIDIFVLDNNSSDSSASYIMNNFPKVKLYPQKYADGFVKNHNYLFNYTKKYDYILVLNNDTVLSDNAIQELLYAFTINNDIGIASPQLYYPDGQKQNSGSNNSYLKYIYAALYLNVIINKSIILAIKNKLIKNKFSNNDNIYYVDYVSGACMMIRQDVVKCIGYFDENIFMYGEDTEYCLRAKGYGFKSAIIKNAKVIHVSKGSYKDDLLLSYYRSFFYLKKKYQCNVYGYLFLRIIFKISTIVLYCIFMFTGNKKKNIYKRLLKI